MPRQRLTAEELAITDRSSLFNAEYYKVGCGPIPYERNERWVQFFGGIAAMIIRSLHPQSVFDMGCAMGMLVESFWDLGTHCQGVDVSSYAIGQVRPDMRRYCQVGSVTDLIDGRYDLITCIEVLEHVLPEEAQKAIAGMAAVTDTILFSSTPNDFVEETHVNVQPVVAWIEQFGAVGFAPDLVFDASFVSPHSILFRRTDKPMPPDVVVLYSKFITFRMGVVERDERIKRLNVELADSRSEKNLLVRDQLASAAEVAARLTQANKELLDQKQTLEKVISEKDLRITTSRDELTALFHHTGLAEGEVRIIAEHVDQLREENAHQKAANVGLAQHLNQLKENDIRALEQQVTQLREENAPLKVANTDLAQQLNQLKASVIRALEQRVTQLRGENSQLMLANTALMQRQNHLQRDLDDVARSPGWKLIERYRKWLWHQQTERPRLFRSTERIALRLLRAAGSEPPVGSALVPTSRASLASRTVGISAHKKPPAHAPFSTAKEATYQRWIDEHEPDLDQLNQQREDSTVWNCRPLFSIVLPIYRVSTHALTECIQSVIGQSYEHWELCIAYSDMENQTNKDLVLDFASRDERIRVKLLESNLGISGNTNAAVEMVSGPYVAFIDHDDALAPSALFETAALLHLEPEAGLIYSDHDYIQEEDSLRFQPLFKPDWSPEIMYSANYVTHLTVVRTELLQKVGSLDPDTDGAQDWDLAFRIIETAPHIEHIPKVLYHWRVHPGSTALNSQAKGYVDDAQLRAISRHMARTSLSASPERMANGLLHVHWKQGAERMVSIIIPSRDNVGLLAKCVTSILEKTSYRSYEILIIDTGSTEQATRDYYAELEALKQPVRVLDFSSTPFNYSAANNFGARHAQGDLLLFLNNDTEITSPQWMNELAGWAAYAPIGIVGGRLLFPNGTIQHAGVVVGLGGFADHPFAELPPLTYGMFGSTGWYRNYLAVTGACMIMRREIFDTLGGFDESFILCGSDVEICLRARDHGYRIVYNPFAELLHHERQTRKTDIPAQDFVVSARAYRKYMQSGDPYWNPGLSLWDKKIGFHLAGERSSMEFVVSHLKTLSSSSLESDLIPAPVKLLAPKRPPSEEQVMVHWFDFSEAEVKLVKQQAAAVTGFRKVETIVWLIPPFLYGFYGGIFTILNFADYWRRRKGVRNIFAVCGAADPAAMLARIKEVLPDCQKSDVYVLPGVNDVSDLPEADAGIATLWLTAYFALRYRKAARKFYFIQDYEPSFYSAGSTSGLVESTYRLGYYGITNTVSLRKSYEDEYGGKATHFTPCVDQKLFRPPETKRASAAGRPWQVCCYARPSTSRNAFELLAAGLRRLKSRLGDKVRIVTAGEKWDSAEYELQGIVENLGVLPYADTAALYRESDVGVVLMLTRHPSYIPMELMASGCLVVTNRNHWTEWLLKHEQNCLLSHNTATSLADTIERGLTDGVLREEITQCALKLVQERYHDWGPGMESVYNFMCDPDGTESRRK